MAASAQYTFVFADLAGYTALTEATAAPKRPRPLLRLRDAVEKEPLFLGVRIGIDAGAAVEQGGHYFGPALDIAVRAAAHAHVGQIVCTSRVASAAVDPTRRPLCLPRDGPVQERA